MGYHNERAFVTLTYDDDNFPKDYSLHKKPLQNFFKRLRKNTKKYIKYFACGEYGDGQGIRGKYNPHYHFIIFGYDFDFSKKEEKVLLGYKNDKPQYTTKILQNLWPYGQAHIGSVTRDSINYVTGYILKKLDGEKSDFIVSQNPCFQICSQGLGLNYLIDNLAIIKAAEKIKYNGYEVNVPRYYKEKLLDIDARSDMEIMIDQTIELNERYGYVKQSGSSVRDNRLRMELERIERSAQDERNQKARTRKDAL